MNTHTLARVCLLLALIFLHSNSIAGQYVPWKSGDFSVYQSDAFNNEVVTEIDNSISIWRHFTNFAGFGSSWLYSTENSEQVYLFESGTISYHLFVDFNWPVGTTNTVNIFPCNSGELRIVDKGLSLTVPAGTFGDVVQLSLQSSCADAGVVNIWFARNIGIIKWTELNIAGGVNYELTEASINGVDYPQVNNDHLNIKARFPDPDVNINLFAFPTPEASSVLVGMTLENNLNRDFVLNFPSYQHFDIYLRNDDGRIVSRWSRGKNFAQANDQRTIRAGESFNVEGYIELLDRDGNFLPSGEYTLEIFLESDYAPTVSQKIDLRYSN